MFERCFVGWLYCLEILLNMLLIFGVLWINMFSYLVMRVKFVMESFFVVIKIFLNFVWYKVK